MRHRPWNLVTRTAVVGAAAALALAFTGVGAAPAGAKQAHSHSKKAASAKHVVRTATVSGMGVVLVDAHRHALYTHTDADGNAVPCTDECASIWKALTVKNGKVKAPKGVKALSTTGADHQVTVDGLPLYTFAQDTKAKEAKGDGLNGFGGTWHVVTVKAANAKSSAKSGAKSDANTKTNTEPTTNAGSGGVAF